MLLLLCLAAGPVFGITLEQLRRDSRLTPHRFARYFSDFKFEFHPRVQSPQAFLARRAGDCDDYATLAAAVLREKGYTPRLITVRMPGRVHVVCYVAETHSYLDYNNRDRLFATVHSRGTLPDIARKVAKSFDTRWLSASEFVFRHEAKEIVATVSSRPLDGNATPMQLAGRVQPGIHVQF
jgi:Transglutaminase-like domain